jgi:uncharacterized protein YheU (UPF0270 family)
MTNEVVYNTSPFVLTVGNEGQQLGAQEFGTVDTDVEAVRKAIQKGNLIVVKKPKGKDENINPQVQAAFARIAPEESVSLTPPEGDGGDNESEPKAPKTPKAKPKTGN